MKIILIVIALMIACRLLFQIAKRNLIVRTIIVLVKSCYFFFRYTCRFIASDYKTAKKFISKVEQKYKKVSKDEKIAPATSVEKIETKITEALEQFKQVPQLITVEQLEGHGRLVGIEAKPTRKARQPKQPKVVVQKS